MAEKKEPNKLQPVVQGKTQVKKRTVGDKFHETFTPDRTKGVAESIIFDILIPAAKNTLFDMVCNGFRMTLWGDSPQGQRVRPMSSSYSNNGGSRISYNNYSRGNGGYYDDGYGARRANMAQAGFTFDNIEFDYRDDAAVVLDRLRDALDPVNGFGMVSVANLYEAAGVRDGWNYIYNDWGWYDLNSAYVDRLNDGKFIIRFPKPTSLK